MTKAAALSLAILLMTALCATLSLAWVFKKDPLEPLNSFLLDRGWSAFYIPSARFRPGSTILASSQDLKLDQTSCFPKLRTPPAQPAVLPEIERGRNFSVETGVAFVRGLLGSIKGSIAEAHSVHIAFSGVNHLAVDIKVLSDSYSSACDPFLELLRDPVVIAELLQGRPAVTFSKKDGEKIAFSIEKIKQIFSVTGKLEFEIHDNATLISNHALYFAYKAVKPTDHEGRKLFTYITPEELRPNYFAVWERSIHPFVYMGPGPEPS